MKPLLFIAILALAGSLMPAPPQWTPVQPCVDAGSTDSYTCTITGFAAYSTGQTVMLKANTANTGAASLAVNGLSAITIVKVAGGIATTLANNDIRAGQWVQLVYDGTNFQMQSGLGNAGGGSGTVTDVSWTGGLVSIATSTTTPAFTVAGTSGGIPYFSSSSAWASSAALTANAPVIGGGAGAAPTVGTRSGNTTTFATTTGTLTSGDCAKYDANGNLVAQGAACNIVSWQSPAIANWGPAASSTYYWMTFGGGGWDTSNCTAGASGAENYDSSIIPVSGTITAMYISTYSSVAATGAGNVTFTLQINCVATSLTNSHSLTTDKNVNSVGTGSVSVTAGDRLMLKAVTPAWSGAPSNVRTQWALKIVGAN